MNRESIGIGKVSCDFMDKDEFMDICREWLQKGSWHHVVTLNPEMVMRAEYDEPFRTAMQQAALRVPDGAGLVWARWYLRCRWWPLWPSLLLFLFQPVERVTGVDAVKYLARLCSELKLPLYLLGGAADNAKQVAGELKKRFKDLIVYTSPEHNYDVSGPDFILKDIIRKKPAVLLVAYGAPGQTSWLDKHRQELSDVRIGIGVGGAFDILSEKLPRAPKLLQSINLEWLWRLYLEPSRWPRIWEAVVRFPLLVNNYKSK